MSENISIRISSLFIRFYCLLTISELQQSVHGLPQISFCQGLSHLDICKKNEDRGVPSSSGTRVAAVQASPSNPCNSSLCGPNSRCRNDNGRAACSCIPPYRYIGTLPGCRHKPECVVSSECPSNRACTNQKCTDPCPGVCGQNANCQVINHRPICSCGAGFTGNPFARCNSNSGFMDVPSFIFRSGSASPSSDDDDFSRSVIKTGNWSSWKIVVTQNGQVIHESENSDGGVLGGSWPTENDDHNSRFKFNFNDLITESIVTSEEPSQENSMTIDVRSKPSVTSAPIVRTPTGGGGCDKSITTVNGVPACSASMIFESNFKNKIDKYWANDIHFNRDESEFVVFDNISVNIYCKSNFLTIRPTLLDDYYGEKYTATESLDLTTRCTIREDELRVCKKEKVVSTILPPVMSARLTTKESFSFKYGVVEIKAKLPRGDWVIPEIWLHPKAYKPYGVSNSGRVIVAKSIGNSDLNHDGISIGNNLLTAGLQVNDKKRIFRKKRHEGLWSNQFHVYRLDWTPRFVEGGEGTTSTSRPTTTTTTRKPTTYERPPTYGRPTQAPTQTTTDKIVNREQGPGECKGTDTTVNGEKSCSGYLIFESDFSKEIGKNWTQEVHFNQHESAEFVVFDNREVNSYIESNHLTIQPTLLDHYYQPGFTRTGSLDLTDRCTSLEEELCKRDNVISTILPPVMSARLTTKETFSFKYGIVEIKAKLPRGSWVVPEIWLQPKAHKPYGAKFSGKIVVAKSIGNTLLTYQGISIGNNLLSSGLEVNQTNKIFKKVTNTGLWSDHFHIYRLEWTPSGMIFYVDGESYGTWVGAEEPLLKGHGRVSPFDQEFYLLLGIHVGGYYDVPNDALSGGIKNKKPWSNTDPKRIIHFYEDLENWHPTWNSQTKLKVDYIRVWAL